MADEITVTVTDATPLTISVEGDTAVTVSSGEAKEGYAIEKFTGLTGVNQVVALGNTFRANSLLVLLNGIPMERDVDFTEATGRDAMTILITLIATDKLEARYVVN